MTACGVLLLLGCGGGQQQPEPAPAYDPVNAAEAPTECPSERKAAQSAREDLLEKGGNDAREAAAMAVLAQADCEAQVFESATVSSGSMERITDDLRRVREQMGTARTLYEEVLNYQSTSPSVGAYAGLGQLHQAFARKLRGLSTPTDVDAQGGAMSFTAEVDGLAASLDQTAYEAYMRALEALSALPERGDAPPLSDWKHEACTGLGQMAGPGRASHPLCPVR